MSFEALLEDEDNQKNGVTYILDESGFRISHLAHVNLRDVQKVMINGEKGWPMRHKNIHWVNVPKYISALYDLALSMFSRKLQSRMFVHFEVSSLHEHIAPEILPKEFGGTIPVAVMADAWIKKLEEMRDLLMSHDLMGVDESKRVKKDKRQGYGLMRLWNSITRCATDCSVPISPPRCSSNVYRPLLLPRNVCQLPTAVEKVGMKGT
ncbi:hypothetical protein HPB47_002412 [Ixodes persulcatus]|uniref:Uncharacterized protein n=1 Tax=Ixodes persulcatus TaxID=34615 RepID=A0AC60PM85_IXOPE|nr:hypothetical protein HPB47_002412 [Ixodes persulcatus]